mmetsp:Transcript_117003/g.225704  ORF Transcript_117003/g.225704 Transcript_117003/m.225704 type:complete len:91 (+) Transcript_117003:873-1145(+)
MCRDLMTRVLIIHNAILNYPTEAQQVFLLQLIQFDFFAVIKLIRHWKLQDCLHRDDHWAQLDALVSHPKQLPEALSILPSIQQEECDGMT